MSGVSVMVLIMVLSFAIDRVVKALLFLSSLFDGPWSRWLPDPLTIEEPRSRARAENRQTLAYYILAGILGLVVLAGFANIRVIKALGYDASKFVDWLVTGIVLIGGSDFVGKILEVGGLDSGAKPKSQPLEITGKLILENSVKRSEVP